MNLETYLRQNPDASDAAAAAGYNAHADNWREITTDQVYAWLADAGRMYTLRSFADSIDPANDPPQVVGLKSALATLLAALNNPTTTLDPTPGSAQRGLIDAVATAGIPGIDEDSVGLLLNAGRLSRATVEDVAGLRARMAAEDAQRVREEKLASAHSAALVIIEQGGDDAAVQAAFVAEWGS